MGLRGATIERIAATADVNGDPRVAADLVLTFTVVVAARPGRRWEYGTGPMYAEVAEGGDDLTQAFDFLARDKFGEPLDDLAADGYDGPRPEAGFRIEWAVSETASESWRSASGRARAPQDPS